MSIDPKYRSEFTLEELERLDRGIAELRQAWEDKYEVFRPKLLERYLAGHLQLHLRIRIVTREDEGEEFGAFLGRPFELGVGDWRQLDCESRQRLGVGAPPAAVLQAVCSWPKADFAALTRRRPLLTLSRRLRS